MGHSYNASNISEKRHSEFLKIQNGIRQSAFGIPENPERHSAIGISAFSNSETAFGNRHNGIPDFSELMPFYGITAFRHSQNEILMPTYVF